MCGFLFISFFRYSKTAVSDSSIIGQREEGKVKEKSTVLHENYYLFSYQGSVCRGSRYWFCRYFNNEVPIKNLPFALPFSGCLFTAPHQGLASYNETSIISLIGSFTTHYIILNKTNLKSHPVILQSHKLVCN